MLLGLLLAACSTTTTVRPQASPSVQPTKSPSFQPQTSPSVWAPGHGNAVGTLQIRSRAVIALDLTVEFAETVDAQSQGLMDVMSMPDTVGMAFLFPGLSQTGFWMKDTLIPLDAAFWDSQGKIVDIIQMQPCLADPCQTYTPRALYKYALEVNFGLLERKGVRMGDRVTFTRS